MSIMESSRKSIMLFMLVMTGVILLILFSSGNIGYAYANKFDIPASLFQAVIAVVTILAVFIIFSISVNPPMDIDTDIRNDKVSQRIEIEYAKRFVKKARKQGYHDEQIRQGLLRHNWDEKSIDSCLEEPEEA